MKYFSCTDKAVQLDFKAFINLVILSITFYTSNLSGRVQNYHGKTNSILYDLRYIRCHVKHTLLKAYCLILYDS